MELISEATGSRKEADAKDPPSCQSKTMGVPGHEVFALFMLILWWGGLIALVTVTLRLRFKMQGRMTCSNQPLRNHKQSLRKVGGGQSGLKRVLCLQRAECLKGKSPRALQGTEARGREAVEEHPEGVCRASLRPS